MPRSGACLVLSSSFVVASIGCQALLELDGERDSPPDAAGSVDAAVAIDGPGDSASVDAGGEGDIESLANGQFNATAISVGPSGVFWIESGTSKIRGRCLTGSGFACGDAGAHALDVTEGSPAFVASTAKYLAWVERDTGKLFRAPFDGFLSEVWDDQTLGSVVGLATTGSRAIAMGLSYNTQDALIVSFDLDQISSFSPLCGEAVGMVGTIVDGAASAERVALLTTNGIFGCSLTDSSIPFRKLADLTDGSAIAGAEQEGFVFATGTGTTSEIWLTRSPGVPPDGGSQPPPPVKVGNSVGRTRALASNGLEVVWISDGHKRIMRTQLAQPSTSSQFAAEETEPPLSIAIYAGYVYWTTATTVRRKPLTSPSG